jgi:cell pole-organizing protein PopZ
VHSDFQTTSVSGSLDDFCRSMLQLVAELSPCSEERLFITAVNRELVGSRDLSLGDVKALLHKCVQQLEAQGLLKIHGEELVITEPGNGPLEAQGSTERAPEPTREEIPASIRQTIKDHEAGQATGQMEAPQAQADEEGEDGADNQIITESGNGTLEAQGSTENAPEPRMEEIVAHIRQIIKNHEAGQATGQAEAPQAQADEEGVHLTAVMLRPRPTRRTFSISQPSLAALRLSSMVISPWSKSRRSTKP